MRLVALAASLAAVASTAAAQPLQAPVDYGNVANWVCRPGAESVCTTGLDAMVVTADGTRTPQTFQALAAPPIDCFYVYPTVSHEPTPYADMTDTPEVQRIVGAQAGRLTSRCRLFAPVYRQITSAGLRQDMENGAHLDFTGPYRDVRDAWRWYMAHENHGRGVVLVGHSQGTIVLQRLIAEEIDGKPSQRLLVSAFLAGDPSLAVPQGARVGGVFKSTPLCASAAEVGCVYVWADYLAGDTDAERHFGRNPGAGLVAGCVDPAAPSGGAGGLEAYLPRPGDAPLSDPPWVEVVGQLSVSCVDGPANDVAEVRVLPGRFAERLTLALARPTGTPGWGLHRLDVNLTQGDILDVIQAETQTWMRAHP